jgi:hypothetical protein
MRDEELGRERLFPKILKELNDLVCRQAKPLVQQPSPP